MNIKIPVLVVAFMAFLFGGYALGMRHYDFRAVVADQVAGTAIPVGEEYTEADFAPFWKAWVTLDSKIAPSQASSTKPVTNQDKVWGAIQGLAASYGDPYTVFFPPQEAKAFAESVKGSFGGVGMEVTMKDRIITVVTPLRNTPAERAGIKANDRIIEIDGTSTLGMSLDKAVSMMHGDPGTVVRIKVFREAERREVEFTITRAIIEIPIIETELRDGVFVIRLFSFTENSSTRFRDALIEFSSYFEQGTTNKLIIDLRRNPGGYLESAVDIASFFLPEGKEIVREVGNRDSRPNVYKSKGFNVFGDSIRIAVLIDGGSASASEIVASALQDHKKAIIIGERSFGKGSVQELVPVTKDTSLKVTVARWLTPNGNSISDNGVVPDIVVSMSTSTENGENRVDTQLLRAIQELNKN